MRPQILSDQELVSQYMAGNETALERLIHRHKDKVFSSIYMLVKDQYLAEDIFQDTFIKAIDRMREGRYNDEGKFGAWIGRIAHNLCIDYFRKVKRSPNIVTSEGDDAFKWMTFETSTHMDHREQQSTEQKIKDLLEFLPAEQKEVVILRHFMDFSFKEVAEYTNVSINTALGRMRYGLIHLRRLMREHNIEVERLPNG